MRLRKELIWANLCALIWLLAVARVWPVLISLALLAGSLLGLVLLSAKLNGLSLRREGRSH